MIPTLRCSARRFVFRLEHFLADPQPQPLVKTAFAHLNPSGMGVFLEEVGDPKFMNRHAGVSGGAISQDQAYFLNKSLVAIKRPRICWTTRWC